MDTSAFKKLLVVEKQKLETTLSSVGTKNPANPSDWEPTYPDLDATPSDKSELADEVEEFDNAIGIEAVLEDKLRDVDAALERIEAGTYGKCAVGGEDVETARLEANPAARTCIMHSADKAAS